MFGLFLGIQNQQSSNITSKLAELAKRKHALSLVSNCKTYHVISDKIAQRYTAQFETGRHQIERTLRNAVFAIMQFCVFCIQISNKRAYATIRKNEFSKNNQDFRKKPTEATMVLYGYCSMVYGLMTGWLLIWWFYVPFSLQFCVLINVFSDYKSFSLPFGLQHPLSYVSTFFPVELTIYNARFSESIVFSLSINCQRTELLLKEKIFVINIPLVRTFTVFT